MNVTFDPDQLSYRAGIQGYMLTYSGQPIGGAGTLEPSRHWRHRQADLKGYGEDARREIQHLKAGRGQARFLEVIARLEHETQAGDLH